MNKIVNIILLAIYFIAWILAVNGRIDGYKPVELSSVQLFLILALVVSVFHRTYNLIIYLNIYKKGNIYIGKLTSCKTPIFSIGGLNVLSRKILEVSFESGYEDDVVDVFGIVFSIDSKVGDDIKLKYYKKLPNKVILDGTGYIKSYFAYEITVGIISLLPIIVLVML